MDILPKAPEIAIEDISIVLLGDFNPKIFHPMWFAHESLIRETEAEDARIEILHQDIASFAIDWLTIQVLRDRFTAGVKADVYQPHLGDLVERSFSLLSHSPVRQLGINVTSRVRFRSEADWHAFGHYLAPKSPWNKALLNPGLRGMHMQGRREGDRPGFVVVSTEPDLGGSIDLHVRVNDHFDDPATMSEKQPAPTNAKWVLETLREDYNSSIERSKAITATLINGFLGAKTVDCGN